MSPVIDGKTTSIVEEYWLKEIADSPSGHSAFHHKAIAGAGWALARIASLEDTETRLGEAATAMAEQWKDAVKRAETAAAERDRLFEQVEILEAEIRVMKKLPAGLAAAAKGE